ncbi:HEPN domain-containing protein [Patescibacteria group bacterium]
MKIIDKKLKDMRDYWYDTAMNDWKTALSLWNAKRYDANLFFCHLVLEKLLKGLVIQNTGKPAPYMHDLVELLHHTKIDADELDIKKLANFTSFNIRCRYPKDKLAFYKLCNRDFSEPYFNEAKKLVVWLKSCYPKNK